MGCGHSAAISFSGHSNSSNLAQWAQSGTQVYNPSGKYGSVWAPELHYINGAFYIYVAMTTPDGNNANHRMYVLKGRSTTDPTQPFDVRVACYAMPHESD